MEDGIYLVIVKDGQQYKLRMSELTALRCIQRGAQTYNDSNCTDSRLSANTNTNVVARAREIIG